MTIRFFNCAPMKPKLLNWHVGSLNILVETDQGPVLIDTGLGLHDHESPSKKLRFFRFQFGLPYASEETANRQLAGQGIPPESVQHIVLTHLHFDHAGGLPDFPWAKVHVHQQEHAALSHPKSWWEWTAYDRADFAHQPDWVLYQNCTEKWFEFDARQPKH